MNYYEFDLNLTQKSPIIYFLIFIFIVLTFSFRQFLIIQDAKIY
jgi:hypothetical protein